MYKALFFDFDGLLVNTEMCHYLSYKDAFKAFGVFLDLDFSSYCDIAHHASPESFHDYAIATFGAKFPYSEMREHKKTLYLERLDREKIDLMPGTAELLASLLIEQFSFAVVTNANLDQVELIRRHHPLLQAVPHWITRDDVTRSKPDPEGYLLALSSFPFAPEDTAGLEDTPKGLLALHRAGIRPIHITTRNYSIPCPIEHTFPTLIQFAEFYLSNLKEKL
ncbi:MAG: hypothetical protein A3F09_00530 [Chlamydiae bacterium RIFCSPHIGHO2_12_FULL_49_11]|nr:MAG: hypothetical protein A3F09_00530 [Chlamydiae bacterium RIFCSPHIGHO2_12_FULL_49_11]